MTYLVLDPDNGGYDKARVVCGSNNIPSQARQQREIGWFWSP